VGYSLAVGHLQPLSVAVYLFLSSFNGIEVSA
jgi:hypothetical protein